MRDFATEIANGQHDNDFDEISAAIRARKDMLGKIKVSDLKPGDEVRFSDTIRPKYLVGLTATVVKKNRESVVVNCPSDPIYRKYSGARNVRCPNSLIEGLA